MGRKISFDYDRALDAATLLFWKNGYAETALRDLLEAMEIGEGSFYNTLKSKKNLYLLCLQRYQEKELHARVHALASAPTAALGIRAFFGRILDRLDNPNSPSRLCMFAAMAEEEVLAEPDLRKRAEKGLDDVRTLFLARLTHDRDEGVLAPSLNPPVVAAVITTYLQGLWRMALVGYDRGGFEQQIETFLSGMGL
ncbi:TetR/AcrR family transcriptional regulator [Paraburkholderia rhizosphaerae]|uniref:TetR family transcriptional regulator n=1 Tax=Paraburkholderia rhizosphaerae TaxID=480658 RepID=A0A4R8LSZ2_9BURK|nr:TetR/AcrR family transcriptional regulator [Paraburkholderia rhizosphaerae]TDY50793.1 TetR family transcriptional regulator [Paraburkholderia rhizosphaerae]